MEIFKSIGDWWKERTTSPIWGVYFFTFMFYNWKVIYTLFWEDKSKFSTTTFEFVREHMRHIPGTGFWVFLLNCVVSLGIPMLITFLMIYFFPPIHEWAYGIKMRSHFKRKATYDRERVRYEDNKKLSLESLVEIKKEQKQSQEEINKTEREIERGLSNEDRLGQEFQKFQETPYYQEFGKMLRIIYKDSGWSRTMDIGAIALFSAWKLIEGDGYNTNFKLTNKGQDFSKLYLEKNTI